MFDLFKDLDTYRGIPPYASEHYGVYQPLLGWRSNLTTQWVRRGGRTVDPRLRRILDGRITPGVTEVVNPHPLEFLAQPLEPGSGRTPWRVVAPRPLGSELIVVLRDRVQAWVDAHDGHLPQGTEWAAVIDINVLLNTDEGPLRVVNDRHRERIWARMQAEAGEGGVTPAAIEAGRAELLDLMRFESQIAAMLLFHAEAQADYDPAALEQLYVVVTAPPLSEVLATTDPLATIDPEDRSGVLSPVGFVHLFRQYFFDLGTFLGEPVEHVWLAPGTTIELIEVSTRRVLLERTEEMSLETQQRVEASTSVKDELSDAVRAENSGSTKLGVSTTNTVKVGVYQGSATASLGLESARKDARESLHKQSREQTEKLSSEIKRSYKSVFKTTTETTDSRTRRYVLQNPGSELVNYELRRKMRRVGVQLQDVGERLCWQVFVDDAGAGLGLADFVHYAESPDLANLKEPDPLPPPAAIVKKVTVPIPFSPILNYDDNGPAAIYEWRYVETAKTAYEGKHLGNRANTNDEDAEDNQVVMGPFTFKIDPPQLDYVLTDDIRVLGPQGSKLGQVRGKPTRMPDGSFQIVMQQISFGGEQSVPLDLELVYAPTSAAMTTYADLKKKAQDKYEAEKYRLLQKAYLDNVRDRIDDAASIQPRPSWDLREEERTVVYRALLRRLMMDSWNLPDTAENRRLNHVRSEIVRAIFDVDAMLYFVAPEWWLPRRHQTQHRFDPVAGKGAEVVNLTEADAIRWGDTPQRADNYSITETSQPARLGSSLGWLLQLDGDNLRNAFLNAPWVKAVIPIRPGREAAALNWLRGIEGHEQDGWDAVYVPSGPDDAALVAEVEADGDQPTVGNVLAKIASHLAEKNDDISTTLAADRVFEHGFDPLEGGFNAGLPANEVFSQWISVLPTDQIVAAAYQPTALFEP
ncbi:hypothetical protein SAMN05660690_2947 [Geodermatophilus telluris]|uniref:Uncharacterized protein n=1 Tax=Geodermatophilus telluris TaxID=1190417 RepID=A0A1G6QJ32_9ACTN|nr:hypothetical protein [Geodermatophilus telluris]SDC92333.1 hypothetical protein SAMN05660690_2947 [Geodermatophilus telluris]